MSEPIVNIMIPTFNEASRVQRTIELARALGPVFVLDSHSTDGTQQIARDAGATVVEHAWEGYAGQKNWGLANLPFEGDWVLIVDADEWVTPALAKEVRDVVAGQPDAAGFFVNRLLLIMGKAVRHGGLYPSWNLRLLRHDACRYEDRSVHEHVICNGPTAYLKEELLHVRTESVETFIAKHIRYADLESEEWVRQRLGGARDARPEQLFRHNLRYRQWLRRRVWPRLPGRPLLRFIYMFILRGGFLDGRAGLHMARLMANYEYMIGLLYRDKLKTRLASKQQTCNEAT